MQKLKFYIILSLLIFSINLSSATVGDELSEDVVTDTSFTLTPMSYSLEDTDLDFLHDWLNLIIELDVQNLTEYELDYNIYDNATNNYLYGGYSYFDTTYYGIQSISVPIEGHHFYDLKMTGYIKINVYLYETQNWTYLGQHELVLWINSSDFELPPVIIDESTITVTYFDIETSTNQTIANGDADLIFVDFIYQQQITGYFDTNGEYYTGYQYIYSNNYGDGLEKAAGVYSGRLIFDVETLSNYGLFNLDFSIYGSFYYNNSNNYYYTQTMYFTRTTTGSMFEPPIYTIDFYGYFFVDTDGNSLIDGIEVQFNIDARKSIILDMYVELEFYDGNNWFYPYYSSEINVTAEPNIISFTIDVTMLYQESPFDSFDLYFSGDIYNYWNSFSLHNYTYWNNIAIAHPNYDKPVVYIEYLTFTPGYNQGSTVALDGTGYDFLMVNITVSIKIASAFNYYLDFYDEFTYNYFFSSSSYVDITIGTSTFTTFVDASLLSTIASGNFTVHTYGEVYDTAKGLYFDDWHRSYYAFNSTEFNPTGYYVEPTTPVDPRPEPTDPTDTDPTKTDPINTNVETNTTDALNGTESTEATPDVPVLDLPAPSLYLSLLSIFTVVVILRKRKL